MDGYVWLYEQAYGTHLLFDRLERNWKRRARGSNVLEKAFIAARLAPEMARGDAELRSLFGQGIKLMLNRHLASDAGQLLYLLDGYDFARFMRRYSTARRAENYATFADPARASGPQGLGETMQWQNAKAIKKSRRALPLAP